jgi:hypothetical protein
MGTLPVLKPKEVATILTRLVFNEVRQKGSCNVEQRLWQVVNRINAKEVENFFC